MSEKYIPKVGDKVAIVERWRAGQGTVLYGIVTKTCKKYVMVGDRRFNLPGLRAPRAPGRSNWGSIPDRIEPWSKAHDEQVARGRAISRIWSAIDAVRVTGSARERLEALPIARLEGAAEFLRALLAEAGVKP